MIKPVNSAFEKGIFFSTSFNFVNNKSQVNSLIRKTNYGRSVYPISSLFDEIEWLKAKWCEEIKTSFQDLPVK